MKTRMIGLTLLIAAVLGWGIINVLPNAANAAYPSPDEPGVKKPKTFLGLPLFGDSTTYPGWGEPDPGADPPPPLAPPMDVQAPEDDELLCFVNDSSNLVWCQINDYVIPDPQNYTSGLAVVWYMDKNLYWPVNQQSYNMIPWGYSQSRYWWYANLPAHHCSTNADWFGWAELQWADVKKGTSVYSAVNLPAQFDKYCVMIPGVWY